MANWSTPGRTVGFHLGESFIKQGKGHLYREFYDERKRKAEKDHPEITKLHRHNMARNEMVKLFLSHFWQVQRAIDGKPLTEPYAGAIMGHTHLIEPFYLDRKKVA